MRYSSSLCSLEYARSRCEVTEPARNQVKSGNPHESRLPDIRLTLSRPIHRVRHETQKIFKIRNDVTDEFVN